MGCPKIYKLVHNRPKVFFVSLERLNNTIFEKSLDIFQINAFSGTFYIKVSDSCEISTTIKPGKSMNTKELVKDKKSSKEKLSINNEIILYNDDINTFDHVIETLVRVCNHTAEQAEQCAFIVHYKGKCSVKTDVLAKLIPLCIQLLEANLSAEIV